MPETRIVTLEMTHGFGFGFDIEQSGDVHEFTERFVRLPSGDKAWVTLEIWR